MSSSIIVMPTPATAGPIVVTPSAPTPAPATQSASGPTPMERADFRTLIRLRKTLRTMPKETALATFDLERNRALLRTPGLPPAAVTELVKAIAAEGKRLQEQKKERDDAIGALDGAIDAYETARRQEAREVWVEFLAELNKENEYAKLLAKEIKEAEGQITKLT